MRTIRSLVGVNCAAAEPPRCWRIGNAEHGGGLGKTRWVVDRGLSWLHPFRRLRVRWERRADMHEAFLSLACILITRDSAVRLL